MLLTHHTQKYHEILCRDAAQCYSKAESYKDKAICRWFNRLYFISNRRQVNLEQLSETFVHSSILWVEKHAQHCTRNHFQHILSNVTELIIAALSKRLEMRMIMISPPPCLFIKTSDSAYHCTDSKRRCRILASGEIKCTNTPFLPPHLF